MQMCTCNKIHSTIQYTFDIALSEYYMVQEQYRTYFERMSAWQYESDSLSRNDRGSKINVGSTTLERSMPGRTCFTRYQIRDLCSSGSSSTCSPACTEHQYSLYRNRTCHLLQQQMVFFKFIITSFPTAVKLAQGLIKFSTGLGNTSKN